MMFSIRCIFNSLFLTIMKVILLRDVARVGKRFEVKEVPSGHALNFLIPQKLALSATKEHIQRVEALKARAVANHEEEAIAFEKLVALLHDNPITLAMESNESGHLFKGVKALDIAQAATKDGTLLKPEYIDLKEPIKSIGEHHIPLHFGSKRAECILIIMKK